MLAVVVLSLALQVPAPAKPMSREDSLKQRRRDSLAVVIEEAITTSSRDRRPARRDSVTPELDRTAFLDPQARELLYRARAARITGQVYTIAGPKIAVWAQPRELRAGYAEGAWTPERIADFLPGTVGVDPMPLLEQLEAMARAAADKARPNA